MDENELDNIDDEEENYTDPSGRGSIDHEEPKNPNTSEAFMVVLVLGVLPDVIDFFSLGAFSTFSSVISWPLTEYYFHHKNLPVPNVKKWMRWLNVGDAVPVLGALPLKTIGILISIYVAWHPKSAVSKAVKAADTATGGAKQAPAKTGTGFKQKAKEAIERMGGEAGGLEPEDGESSFEMAYGKEEEGGPKDIYEVTREGAGGLQGPEEEAEAATFGETISTPPQEEEARPVEAAQPKQREVTTATTPLTAPLGGEENKEGTEDETAKIGGAYEEEKEIMETMESTGEIEDILKEKPIPISPPPTSQEVQSSLDEKVVNLKRFKDSRRQDGRIQQEGDGGSLKKAA